MSGESWYRTFFERDYYDRFVKAATARNPVGRDDQAAEQVDFVVEKLELKPGARVLDLCCGYGRHSIPLAQRGFDVTGLDISAYHIEIAEKAAAEAGLSVRWICDDMRNFPVDAPFDAIINMFTAFGYLESDDEDEKVISRVAQGLRRGGRFFLDTNNVTRTLRQHQANGIERLADGSMLLEERTYAPLTGRLDVRWTHVAADGTRTEGEIHPRGYTAAEYVRMFERAGLALAGAWGWFDGSPLEMDSRRMILMARKG